MHCTYEAVKADMLCGAFLPRGCTVHTYMPTNHAAWCSLQALHACLINRLTFLARYI
uniref:Uncharacterized protein n=1 Tax=Oryza brachyantha TaxID=4533 RepID=J3L2U7_ORYBR